MNFYAVKVGHKTGIFDNWNECQDAIKGYSGPSFKGFQTREEAEAFLEGKDFFDEIVEKDLENGYVVAFCDGSFDNKRKRYSFGVFIIDIDGGEYEICSSGANPEYVESHNIIGEILGAVNAMDWAVSNSRDKIKIYHDYEGIAKWITGEWKAKSLVAKKFISIYSEKYEGVLEVAFQKVKGHSNNTYNNKADELARRALSENSRVPISGDNWFSVPYCKENELLEIIKLMSEDYPEIKTSEENRANSKLYKLTLEKNKLSVTLFNNKKLLIQGANTVLFQIFITYVNELLGVQEKNVFSSAYRKAVDIKVVDEGISNICPTFPPSYPDTIKRLIRQSIINLNYFIVCEDYSQYVFPACRALEGHIKYLFTLVNISTTSIQLGSHFEKDPSTNTYYLPVSKTSDVSLRSRLEDCYNYYNTTRHTLFHFGDILGSTDSTRIVETKEEADELIKKCLSFICE